MTLCKQWLVALTLGVLTSNAFALTCDDKSPSFIKEGDKYFNLDNTKPLTSKQREAVKRIFSSLRTRLKGKEVVTSCDAQQGIEKLKLTAQLSFQSDGVLLIELEKYDKEIKSTATETLSYFGEGANYTTIKTSKNSIAFNHKLRIVSSSGVLPFNEKIVKLSVKNGGLTIQIVNFYNGYFAFSRKITLRH